MSPFKHQNCFLRNTQPVYSSEKKRKLSASGKEPESERARRKRKRNERRQKSVIKLKTLKTLRNSHSTFLQYFNIKLGWRFPSLNFLLHNSVILFKPIQGITPDTPLLVDHFGDKQGGVSGESPPGKFLKMPKKQGGYLERGGVSGVIPCETKLSNYKKGGGPKSIIKWKVDFQICEFLLNWVDIEVWRR